jgi:hypothetical protein
MLKANTKFSEKGMNESLGHICSDSCLFFRNPRMACSKWRAPLSSTLIRCSPQGFLRDCPNGKLDKKKFVDVYKQFYPQGKADSFCK